MVSSTKSQPATSSAALPALTQAGTARTSVAGLIARSLRAMASTLGRPTSPDT